MRFKTIWLGALCALLLITAASPAALAEDSLPQDAVLLTFDGDQVLSDGQAVPQDDDSAAVYTAHDIVYYESGHDFTYGEGTQADEHDPAEAAAHTVVHITRPGTYVLRGTLDLGQIAVDLGKDADEDPQAVVTLLLDGVNVTCTVAPAVIFYNVYECDPDGESGYEPDLSGAGARVVIADGSENTVSGSYVARIYKSYTLNDAGTAVTDSKKLHKYDGAFYSKMSMTVSGGPECSGVLNIHAENEGLDTEMHLTIDGGIIHIFSGNDGINCNEDDISVVTVNGGELTIAVEGGTGEGDGIDSNGWLVINSGTVTAQACSSSMDSGLDSACGVLLNGGMVTATGNMLDPLTPSDQCCAVFSFPRRQDPGVRYALTGADGTEYMTFTPDNSFTYLAMSCPALTDGESCQLTADGDALMVASGGGMGMTRPGGFVPQIAGPGPQLPNGQDPGAAPEPLDGQAPADAPEPPDGQDPGAAPEPPDGQDPGDAPEPPDGQAPDAAPELPNGQDPDDAPEPPDGQAPQSPADGSQPTQGDAQAADSFTLSPGLNSFTVSLS